MYEFRAEENYFLLLKQDKVEALDYFIGIYMSPLCRLSAKIISGNTMEAEDIVEEVFIKLWYQRNDFENVNHLKGFLFLTTRNTSLNTLRTTQRRGARNIDFVKMNPSDEEEHSAEIIYTEMLAEVRKAIYELPEKMRKIFILSHYKKMTNQEIADHLHLSQQTIRNQKSKALQLLRDLLGHRFYLLFL